MKQLIVCSAIFLLICANKIRIYLKRERKARRYAAPFYRWTESVHRQPDQEERIRLARTEKFDFCYQDELKGLARLKSKTDPAAVWCNLGMCQCEQFKKTHKPCKHIYKIAIEKGLI